MHLKIAAFFLFFLSSLAFGSEHIILFNMTDSASEINQLKRYLEKRRIKVSLYRKVDNLDAHIENLNKINTSNAKLLIALDMEINEKEDIFLAIPAIGDTSSKPQGKFNFIEDMPYIHSKGSYRLAETFASIFNTKVITLPLFFAIGLDMPCIFIAITTKREGLNEIFEKFYMGLQSYFKQGERNER